MKKVFLCSIFVLIAIFSFSDEIAFDGYDLITVWNEKSLEEGVSEYQVTIQNRTWLFSSQENAGLFASDPDRYLPSFGGICAWGVSRGIITSADSRYWVIQDGLLLVFHSRGTRRRWLTDPGGHIEKALYHWPELEIELKVHPLGRTGY